MKRALTTGFLMVVMATPVLAQMAVSHSQAASAGPNFEVSSPVAGGKPVARINGAVLTDRDLLREMYTIFPYARQHNGGFPKAMEADIRAGALKMIVFEELVYQEALRRKLSVLPAARWMTCWGAGPLRRCRVNVMSSAVTTKVDPKLRMRYAARTMSKTNAAAQTPRMIAPLAAWLLIHCSAPGSSSRLIAGTMT